MNSVKLQDTRLIHRNILLLDTNNKPSEREFKKTISSTTALKRIK